MSGSNNNHNKNNNNNLIVSPISSKPQNSQPIQQMNRSSNMNTQLKIDRNSHKTTFLGG